MMRRTILMVATMALTLLVASGVALAVNKIGTEGPDTLRGTNKADNLIGLGGNDRIFGLAGKDNMLGGPGKDLVVGGTLNRSFGGDKNVVGGRGNDAVFGGLDSDNVVGEEGNDLLIDGDNAEVSVPQRDHLSGGDGNDVISPINKPADVDVVVCGSGFDRVLVDRKDVVAPDCEKVFVGLGSVEAFSNSIPDSFFEGLPPPFSG
jgi:Ca2+-binding RTX toxin-like protein